MENTNYPLQEKIKSFVNDEMDSASRQDLLAEAAQNAELADELAFSESLSKTLKNYDLVVASAVLKNVLLEEGFPPPDNISPTTAAGRKIWHLFLGGAFLLLFIVGGYVWADQSGYWRSSEQQISQNYIQALENVLFLPNTGIGLSDLQSGMRAYDAGQYEEAARKLNAYIQNQPDNAVKVFLGVSYLMSGQVKAAVQPLVDAVQSQELPVQEAASWYLALAHLQNNNRDAALPLLLQLQNSGGVFAEQSRNLIEELRK